MWLKYQRIQSENTYEEFDINAGITQGCMISLVLLAIDLSMKESTLGKWEKETKSNGINVMNQHGDFGFAYDLDLFSHPYARKTPT